MPWTSKRQHAMLTCIRPQLCPIIVWHGKAAFTNIRFWGHVVFVVLFFNKCHWAWFQGTRETKCVAAHACCVSFATPKTWQKMFPVLFQYHFWERHARVEISTLWVSFAFNVWQIHSNLPILGLINVLDMFWAQNSAAPKPVCSKPAWRGVSYFSKVQWFFAVSWR